MKKSKNKGLSLVELIIAVALMAVFAAVLVPSLLHFNLDARMDKDLMKFESICDAFKRSMGEPEVQKEIDKICGNGEFKVVCHINEDGVVVFGDGELRGTLTKPLEDTQLWLNSYQTVGTRYEIEHPDHKNKYIIFELTPKTERTTALCEYELKDTDG